MVHPCQIDNSITLHGHGITPNTLQDPPPCLIHDNHTQKKQIKKKDKKKGRE